MSQISVCMIVKNEEDVIARAISSVRAIASELIVVDTGSTDATVAIAQALGAKVFPFSWSDDFSAARNFSIEQASGDWILAIDADEVIEPADLAKIPALVTDQRCCYELTQRHYSQDSRIQGFVSNSGLHPNLERGYAGYFETRCVRLFPRHPEIRFIGRVHELVEPAIAKLGSSYRVTNAGLRLHHYGHVRGVERDRQKRALYAALATKKAQEGGEKWRALYELGIEKIGALEFTEAIAALEESARLNPAFLLTWVNLGYVLCEEGRFEHARRALVRALSLEPSSNEAYCNLGVVYMRQKRYTEAIEAFFEALKIDQEYLPAYSNLGQVYLSLGQIKEAGGCFLRATELSPQSAELRTDLGQVYLLAGAIEESEQHLRAALSQDERQFKAHYLLAQVRKAQGAISDAGAHLRRVCSLLEESGLLRRQMERAIYEKAQEELKGCIL